MSYDNLTDDEINRRVAVLEGWRDTGVWWVRDGYQEELSDPPPYCSDCSLTFPMAMERGISIHPPYRGDPPLPASACHSDTGLLAFNANPLRAICIVRLMMGDAR